MDERYLREIEKSLENKELAAARAEIERLTKAHDTVCGALAEAIKRAEKAETTLEAYGREKVREGMKRAATICDSYCAEYWETGGLDHLLATRDAILAEMEKDGGE